MSGDVISSPGRAPSLGTWGTEPGYWKRGPDAEGQATSARAMGTVVGQACSFDQPSSADTGSKSYQPKWLAFSFPPTFEYSVGYVTPINV